MSKLSEASDRVAAKAAIDGAIVIVVIQALANLIGTCLSRDPTPEQVAAAAKHPRWRHRKAMRNAALAELERRGQADKFEAMMRAIHGEISVMTVEEIADVCRECTQLTADYS